MKKVIVCVICCASALVLILLLLSEKRYSQKIEKDLLNCYTCNEYQSSMSNYVIEHYNEISDFGKRVMQDYDVLTYKDKFGRSQMENDTYKELLSEYNLGRFGGNKGYGYIEFYEDKICFIYDDIEFENGYYGYFYFTYENDKIVIQPYVYDLLNKHGY